MTPPFTHSVPLLQPFWSCDSGPWSRPKAVIALVSAAAAKTDVGSSRREVTHDSPVV
jgi:hypothetical protein